MERLAHSKKTFRLIRIDIDRWDSPVAHQYGIRRLPTLWLYEGERLKTEETQDVLEFLQGG